MFTYYFRSLRTQYSLNTPALKYDVTYPGLIAMAGGKQELKRSITIIPCFVFVELGIMAGTVVLAYHFEYSDTFPVHFQGFFCYDNTLAKPYPGPEDSSRAPPVLVYSLVTAVPTFTILVGELAVFFFQPTRHKEKTIISGECCYFNPLLRRMIRFLGQVVTGNQTPHFLSVCQPNYTVLGCQPPPGTIYVTDKAACTGNPLLVTAACKAFPSKDAALSAYAVAYTVMYVTLVFHLKGSRLAKPSLCLVLLGPAFLVGVVRVAEYRNHWSDVLAGFLTGGAIAIFLVTCVVNNFQSPISSAKKVSPPENLPSVPVLGLPCVDSSLNKLSVAQQVRDTPEEFSTLLSRGLERQLARSLHLAAPGSAAMTHPYELQSCAHFQGHKSH
ncbi:phospholipid phosphatase-related protein type 2 isoform X8 [Erythrolamprus reginae]|uniref:phospholipid phosphatase-related protein type 2 isoform X8 n=2 Tax=Erythrolamprus reginae TaxID=121349 RepID=UPI00396C8C34